MTITAEPPTPATRTGRVSVREYFSTQAELFTKSDAMTIGPELERLANEGRTKLADIVDAARPAGAPLHRYFEWDDRRAAEGFRQMQAGRMTRAIMVYRAGGGQERQEPAFRPVVVKSVPTRPPAPTPAHQVPIVSAPTVQAAHRALSPSNGAGRRPTAVLDAAPLVVTDESAEMPDTTDDGLIERALQHLHAWEQLFADERSRPPFESIFSVDFEAIAEARARAGEVS